jgi:hypothetical protein
MALPHGPGLNPWQLLKWAKNPVAFYEKNAAHYGDMFTLRFPVVYLLAADKYPRLTHRPSQGQKGIDERVLLASQRPSPPW